MATLPPSFRSLEPAAQDASVHELARSLHLARGSFALFFASCNDAAWRDQCIRSLDSQTSGFVIAACSADTVDPLDAIPKHEAPPAGIHLTRLELAVPGDGSNLGPLRLLNLHRARWQQLGCPIVIWLPEYLLGLLLRHAPDFGNWRSGSLQFIPARNWRDENAVSSYTSDIELAGATSPSLNAVDRQARIKELTNRSQDQLRPETGVADAYQAEWCRELAVLHAQAGDVEQAWHWQHLAMSWESPTYKDYRIFSCWQNFGSALLQGGHLTEAQKAFTESRLIAERHVTGDPATAMWQRQLSVSLIKLGDLAVAQGDVSAALKYYTKVKDIRKGLAAGDPGNAWCNRDLSVPLIKLGDLSVAQGDLAGALGYFTQAKDITEELARTNPGHAGWHRDLSVPLIKLGDLALEQGDLAEALGYYTQAKDIREGLAGSDPGNAGSLRDLSVSLERLGDLALAQGDLAEASGYYTQAKDIHEGLAGSDPGHSGWQRDLSVSLERLGDLALAQGDLAAALGNYTQAKDIREGLAGSDPGNAVWQRDLWVSYWAIADVCEKKEEPKKARDWWQKAYATLASMKDCGLHISQDDLGELERLRTKLGKSD